MARILVLSFFLAAIVVIDAAIITRNLLGVQRYILYQSRVLEGECVPTCEDTEPPTSERCECAEGEFYMVEADGTCECATSCCDACPDGTFCSESDGECECVGCECGFCDSDFNACCNMNGGGNNCNANRADSTQDNSQCGTQTNRFPHSGESGNACGGVEISKKATSNGCGCKPNSEVPCTFDVAAYLADTNTDAEKDICFICAVEDWVSGSCQACRACILANAVDVVAATNCFDDAESQTSDAEKAEAYADCFSLKDKGQDAFTTSGRAACTAECFDKDLAFYVPPAGSGSSGGE